MVCRRTCCFVATWQQILGGGVDALPSCLEQVGDIVVSNIGQSQSRVTDLADDSCGKMAAQKVVRGAGMGDWQGVSSHALGTVTVNQVHNIVVPRLNINTLVMPPITWLGGTLWLYLRQHK